jgi:hypothetical protein
MSVQCICIAICRWISEIDSLVKHNKVQKHDINNHITGGKVELTRNYSIVFRKKLVFLKLD